MKKLWILASVLILTGIIQAQSVPDFVNYQGRLTDDSGAPLATGDYALRFEVYDDPVAGSRVWGPLCFDRNPPAGLDPGHKYVVPVVQGYFNVVLDQDTGVTDCTEPPGGDPAPVSTAFTAGLRYVEVAVWNETGSVWEPILPRQHVLSAPYAVSAMSATSADRSREVVSGVDESTRIACQTSARGTVDVITVDTAGVGVAGDLTVLNNASVDGNVDVGTALVVDGTADIEGWADQNIEVTPGNGYAWVGSILVQWGDAVSTSDDDQVFSFPTSFDTKCLAVTFSIPGVSTARTVSNFTINRMDNYPGSQPFTFIAIGY